MQALQNLGLGLTIVLGMVAGLLIGATYALYQTVRAAREAGQSTADIVRHYGVFAAVVLMLWLTFISYAYLQWQSAAAKAAADTPAVTGIHLSHAKS